MLRLRRMGGDAQYERIFSNDLNSTPFTLSPSPPLRYAAQKQNVRFLGPPHPSPLPSGRGNFRVSLSRFCFHA